MPQVKPPTAPVVRRARWAGIAPFAVIFCIMAALAMVHENAIFGFSPGKDAGKDKTEAITATADGEVINTTGPGADILGYGGNVPLEIYVTAGRIDSV